jgi:hypothetical protein
LTTTANNETNRIARTGCCALQAETRPAQAGPAWNSGLDAGLKAWDWFNFIKHQFFRGKTLVLRLVSQNKPRQYFSMPQSKAADPETMKNLTDWNIDDLIVVNAKREPVGLVDSQDLPKLKIV